MHKKTQKQCGDPSLSFGTRFCTAGRGSKHGAAWWWAVDVQTKNANDYSPENL
jgi:hypothetical protein